MRDSDWLILAILVGVFLVNTFAAFERAGFSSESAASLERRADHRERSGLQIHASIRLKP